MQAKDDQAEHRPSQRIDAQPQVHEGRAEHCTTATLAATVDARGRAEQQSTSSSSPDNTHHTRQSHTKKWAVVRYVQSPIISCNKHILTPSYTGTHITEDQAEQKCIRAELCATEKVEMQTLEDNHPSPRPNLHHPPRMLPITPSAKRKLSKISANFLQVNLSPQPPPALNKISRSKNENQPRKPKIWREFSSINGNYRLMEVRDYGIHISSKKKTK